MRKLVVAKNWLKDQLRNGETDSRTIKVKALGDGFSYATLKRAKKVIGVQSVKKGLREGWDWVLPEGAHREM